MIQGFEEKLFMTLVRLGKGGHHLLVRYEQILASSKDKAIVHPELLVEKSHLWDIPQNIAQKKNTPLSSKNILKIECSIKAWNLQLEQSSLRIKTLYRGIQARLHQLSLLLHPHYSSHLCLNRMMKTFCLNKHLWFQLSLSFRLLRRQW
jgi:hypothetical protein